MRLVKSLGAWGTPAFPDILKREIEGADSGELPLQEALSRSSYAMGDNLRVIILNVSEEPRYIHVKAGLFFTGVIAGCSCADDPTPVEGNTEYCELLFDIDKDSAETVVTYLGSE